MALFRLLDEHLQIGKVAVNISNKQPWTADKGCRVFNRARWKQILTVVTEILLNITRCYGNRKVDHLSDLEIDESLRI